MAAGTIGTQTRSAGSADAPLAQPLLRTRTSGGTKRLQSRSHGRLRYKEPRMLAMDYRGPYRVRTEQKPMPTIQHPRDAIIRVSRTCICGSDLHLYHGL